MRLLAAFSLLAVFVLPAQADSFSFAAIGDLPYGSPQELAEMAGKINRQPVAFTIHVGDIKSGGSRCSDEVFLTVHSLFGRFDQPLVYTPGDNEWTDCHRRICGSYDPLERLEKLRTLFFASTQSLGRQPMPLASQGSDPRHPQFVENRRWHHGRVSFATLHLVGSNNNWQPELPSVSEFPARNAANIRWMRDTFAAARARDDVAIVLAMQADTFFGKPGPDSGYAHWLAALADELMRWEKPVLLIQGDTHVYRVDRPMRSRDGKPLDNVLRVVVPGERAADAVMIEVDERRPEQPFRIRTLGSGA